MAINPNDPNVKHLETAEFPKAFSNQARLRSLWLLLSSAPPSLYGQTSQSTKPQEPLTPADHYPRRDGGNGGWTMAADGRTRRGAATTAAAAAAATASTAAIATTAAWKSARCTDVRGVHPSPCGGAGGGGAHPLTVAAHPNPARRWRVPGTTQQLTLRFGHLRARMLRATLL